MWELPGIIIDSVNKQQCHFLCLGASLAEHGGRSLAYGLVASSRLRRDTPPLHQDLFRGHSSAPFCRSAAHRAAYDDARARSDWCCTPWAPILLQVSAQGLLPREGRNPRSLQEDHVHNDDRTPRLRRKRPRRTIPSAWGVDAMGGSVVGGRTAQRSRGGVTSELLRRSPPHLLVQQCEQQTVHHWQNMGGMGCGI